jgi:hypothetical protein
MSDLQSRQQDQDIGALGGNYVERSELGLVCVLTSHQVLRVRPAGVIIQSVPSKLNCRILATVWLNAVDVWMHIRDEYCSHGWTDYMPNNEVVWFGPSFFFVCNKA